MKIPAIDYSKDSALILTVNGNGKKIRLYVAGVLVWIISKVMSCDVFLEDCPCIYDDWNNGG